MKVLIIGAAGMIGRKLSARLARDGRLAGRAIAEVGLVDVVTPQPPENAPFPVALAAFDIATPYVAPKLIAGRPDMIFLLASVVSGEAEADFDKGYAINLGGTHALFEAIRREQALSGGAYRPRLVFTSSIAVFGAPFPEVIGDEFLAAPLTSYGTQKAISELLLADYSRRGFLDGIGLRLPTICVRPGAPNLAASGFFSGIIREPLVGKEAILPVGDEVRHWHASPRSAVEFLLRAAELDTSLLGPRRTLNLPGVSVSVGEQIEALRQIAGEKAVGLIRRRPDETIARIVAGWPSAFDPARAQSVGFRADANFSAIIRAHIEDELGLMRHEPAMLDVPARRGSEAESSTTASALALGTTASNAARRPRGLGLAARVLIVTIGFVLLAMGLFYASRLAAVRETWLHNKLASAQMAVEAFDSAGTSELPGDLSRKILSSVGVKSIAIRTSAGRRVLAVPGAASAPVETVNLDSVTFVDNVAAAFRTLFAAPGTTIRVSRAGSLEQAAIEVTLDEAPLIDAMWRVSRIFLNISLTVAAVLTCVLWAALWHMVLRPVRRLTWNIIAFGELPQDSSRVISPSGRRDEIGRAEAALAAMQESLAHELTQRKRLSELGMAVARINHDLRNMLSAAQLISDRLATIPDPLAQRLAPRLVATLDRAIQFCQATLSYGAAGEKPPDRRRFDLSELVSEAVEAARAESGSAIDYDIDIPPRFELYADPDHILRVLENLGRNAAQALMVKGALGGRPKAMRLAAIRTDGVALIEISDTGPGFPPDQSDRIFEPFHKSTSGAGAGLGLAIAADLVSRNGGAITLAPAKADDFYCGARFLIKLPIPERAERKSSDVLPEP